jgi:tRNA-dihydrouridine synthase
MSRHARLLVDWAGPHGIRDFRKHTTWYLKGYPTGPAARRDLKAVESPDDLEGILGGLLDDLGRGMGIDPASLRIPRSHRSGPRRVVLPDGWLDDPEDMTPPPAEAEALVSGG